MGGYKIGSNKAHLHFKNPKAKKYIIVPIVNVGNFSCPKLCEATFFPLLPVLQGDYV
jgi:hypothetical protein